MRLFSRSRRLRELEERVEGLELLLADMQKPRRKAHTNGRGITRLGEQQLGASENHAGGKSR